jgi:hypothetical protein
LDLRIARRITSVYLVLLLLPATAASAKQFYPITMSFADGGPLCARRPEHRTIVVDGRSVNFQNPFEHCTGELAPNGSFAIACSAEGTGVSYKLAGRIAGPAIAGSFDFKNEKRRASAEIECSGTFSGARRGAATARPEGQ